MEAPCAGRTGGCSEEREKEGDESVTLLCFVFKHLSFLIQENTRRFQVLHVQSNHMNHFILYVMHVVLISHNSVTFTCQSLTLFVYFHGIKKNTIHSFSHQIRYT